MEREGQNFRLEALKMDKKHYGHLLMEVAILVMNKKYKDYEKSSQRVSRERLRLPSTAKEEDRRITEEGDNFVELLVRMGSIEEIEKFCKEKNLEGFPDRSQLQEMINFNYQEMVKEQGKIQ